MSAFTELQAELEIQHTVLRDMMDNCLALADDLDAGQVAADTVLRAVAKLRMAFEAHTKFEEQMLGDLRVMRLTEHVAEHRALHDRLDTSATPTQKVTIALRLAITRMREHIDSEQLVQLR